MMIHDGTKEESRTFVVCLLCKETFDFGKQHDRHLARHLQELSLFVLPSVEQDSDVGEDGGAASSSDTESVSAAMSQGRSISVERLPANPIEHQATMEGTESLSEIREKEKDKEDHKHHNTASWRPEERRRDLQEEAMEKQRLLGSEHPDTLAAMTKLTRQYLDSRLYQDATDLGQQVMKTKKDLLGVEHLETLQSMLYLAQSYQGQKQYTVTESLYQQALGGYEKACGSNNEMTIDIVHHLGDIYSSLGRFEEAEMICRRELKISETTKGPYHLSTIFSVTRLGNLCYKIGKQEEAKALYQQALVRYEKMQHPNPHLLSLTTSALIDIYRQQGKLAEAEELSKQLQSRAGFTVQ